MWYTIAGQDNWQLITFVGKTAAVTSLPAQTDICVKYIAQNDAAKLFTVPASIIPSEVYLELEGALFNAGTTSYTQSSRVGSLFVEVPRFLFDGKVDLAMSATGASKTNLSGSALAYYTSTSCDNLGSYAKVTQVITGASWDADLEAMGVSPAEISVPTGNTTTLNVIGIYKGGYTGSVNPANLTFTVTPSSLGTVAQATGIFTAGTAGSGTVQITDTTNTSIDCYAYITVT